jgi:beta-galactosidase
LIDAKEADEEMRTDMGIFFQRDPWPVFINFQGDLDLIGNPKAPYYYRHVVWGDSPAEMLVHRPVPEGKTEITSPWGFPDELKSWTWPGHENETFQVHVYTRSQLVKLELNGREIGEQAVNPDKSITATFNVPYEPGILIARSYDTDGNETGADTLITVGEPAAIRLVADRSTIEADRNDLSYVMAEVIDARGNVVPYADDIWINFEISGNGEIAGVGSGSPVDMSSFQQPGKKSWQGRCLAIVRPSGVAGRITLAASADGLEGTSIEIIAEY